MSGREQVPDYQIIFRNLNKVPVSHVLYMAIDSALFMSSSLNL